MRMHLRTWGVTLGIVALAGVSVAAAATNPPPKAIFRGASTAVRFDVSPPLRLIAPKPFVPEAQERDEWEDRPTGLERPSRLPGGVDRKVQGHVGAGEIPLPTVSFDAFNGLGPTPPDSDGDVGPNHYVVMVNLRFAVYDKTGTLLFGPANNNTLWSGFGGDCETDNSGDPIVLHDQMSDRWFLTQFTASGPTFFNCVAVSTTSDPTGSYFRYAFTTGGNFPDYPKYGIWPDALYISTREFLGTAGPFQGVGAYAVNRADLVAGNPTPGLVSFLMPPGGQPFLTGDGLLPTDLDGSTPPPAGTPNFYLGTQDLGGPYGAPSDAINVFRFHADFAVPANSTFALANTIPISTYDTIFPCTPTSRECIPQPGTAQKVDILSYRQRPLHRAAYRNFGTHQAIVTNQSVEASTNMAGIRWWEIRDPNGSPTLFQEGTYAPGTSDGIHRWMGSIAMDQDGNMGLGFSASNATTTFPSVWYTGRLASDPAGTMAQGEGSIVNGLGSQTSTGHRWGDYTSMNIDPTDDCTFWYVNEYYPVTSATAWRMRVGAFKFPTCGVAGGSGIAGNVTEFGAGALAGVTVTPSPTGSPTTTDGSGNYSLTLPAGTYDLVFSKAGYYSQSYTGIVVGSGITTQDAVLTVFGGGPDLSIGDVSTVEGNAGTTDAFLPVTLSTPSGSTITADFSTADGTATTADNDYTPISGTLVFNPGETTKNVTVSVIGDVAFEADETYFVSIGTVTAANVVDGIGQGTIINDDFPLAANSRTELIHGTKLNRNLAAAGAVAMQDFFPILTRAHESWEVVVDGTGGDIVGATGPNVDRLASDGTTVVQSAQGIGSGISKSLRWENTGTTDFSNFVRVESGGCTTDCGADDVYRLRSYETTYAVPRFNNSATQITILLIQNTSTDTVNGTIWVWDSTGAAIANQAFSLAPNALLVLNTSTIAPGVGGTITVSNDGPYGALAGKGVAVEPATGFTFDTAMRPRTR